MNTIVREKGGYSFSGGLDRAKGRLAYHEEGLFLARYIEKYGAGTLMMIRESREHALPEPGFLQQADEFAATVWRDWLTEDVLIKLNLNERQRNALSFVRTHERITNAQFQRELSFAKRTASQDLATLVAMGLLEKIGTTGKGVCYQMAKGASKGHKGHGNPQRGMATRKGAANGQNGQRRKMMPKPSP